MHQIKTLSISFKSKKGGALISTPLVHLTSINSNSFLFDLV